MALSELPAHGTAAEWTDFFATADSATARQVDQSITDGLAHLIFNIGPPTEAISLEDEACRRTFTLDETDPIPECIPTAAILVRQAGIADPLEFASDEMERVLWGIARIEITDDEGASLDAMVTALSRDSRPPILAPEWPRDIALFENIFNGYIEDEDIFAASADEAVQMQYLVYPVRRRVEQLLHGLD